MGKILFVIVVFFGIGVAMVLMVRLRKVMEQLGSLGDELRRNSNQLDLERMKLERLAAEEAARRQNQV